MVLTFRAGKLAAIGAACAVALAGLAACSREQQDWRSAEASDTVEGYSEFLRDHPDSGLVKQAHAKLAQLSEDRAWAEAGKADTLAAYNQFLGQYPNGQWSQEARIRVENFELAGAGAGTGSPATGAAASSEGPPLNPSAAVASTGAAGSNPPGTAASSGAFAQVPVQPTSPQAATAAATPPAQVAPGEAAQLPTSTSAAAAVPPSSSSIASAWRSTDLTSYGVQLGAFASENAATSEWQLLVERFNEQLHGLAPRVVSAETATGRLFRLQALVADEATARALCDMLRKQSQACVPVLPH